MTITTYLRLLTLWLAVSLGTVALGRPLAGDAVAALGAVRSAAPGWIAVAPALTGVCEVLLLACLVWAWAATTAVVIETIWARPQSRAVTTVRHLPGVPHAWRRLVLVACGLALGAGTLPAQAAGGPTSDAGTLAARSAEQQAVRVSVDMLDGLPMPRRALSTPAPVTSPQPPAPSARPIGHPAHVAAASVEVRPGDSLWSIARADVGPDAGPDAVAERSAEIHRSNRAAIGADPDLIRPGQRLSLPRTPHPKPQEQR